MNTSSNPSDDELGEARACERGVRRSKGRPHILTGKKIRDSILTDDETIAAPAPVLWFGRATRRHRIQREVTKNRPRVGAVLNDPAPEAALKEMPHAIVSTVEALAVGGIELLQQPRQRMLGRNQQQMVVIPEQAIRNTADAKSREELFAKSSRNDFVVLIVRRRCTPSRCRGRYT